MPVDHNIAGDIAAAAAALAGLLLVFLGGAVNSFASYDKAAQISVKAKYQRMGWLAFVGFIAAISSAFLALLGLWLGYACVTNASLIILFVSFGFVVLAALFTVLEIK